MVKGDHVFSISQTCPLFWVPVIIITILLLIIIGIYIVPYIKCRESDLC